MLYDPKWEKPEVKADPFSLESLIAWLEKQPADREYCYMSCGSCLLSQYFTAHGYANVLIGSKVLSHGKVSDRVDVELPPNFNYIALDYDGSPHRTFGAALDRARAVQKPSR